VGRTTREKGNNRHELIGRQYDGVRVLNWTCFKQTGQLFIKDLLNHDEKRLTDGKDGKCVGDERNKMREGHLKGLGEMDKYQTGERGERKLLTRARNCGRETVSA